MTTVRIVQRANKPGCPLVVGLLLGSQLDPQFKALVGPDVCMVAWQGFGPPEPGAQLIAEYSAVAKSAGWDGTGDVYLIGWSLGCSRIRSILPALTKKPKGVLCLDGTTASFPTPQPSQIDPWRELVRAGRAGEICAVLTCTSMGYTERLKPPDSPFWATLHMLREVTGWTLASPGTPAAPDAGITEEGDLHVVRFASADMDAHAHEDQQNKVLFWAVRKWFQPLWQDVATASTEPPPTDKSPTALDDATALDIARAELAAGVHEDPPHSNTSPRIREYLALCVRNGKPLGLTAGEWCAAFFCWCDREAGGAIIPRAAVAEVWHDAVNAGLAREGTVTPKPGWGAIFARAGEDPRTGGHGHIGRVETVHADGTYSCIEGNHGDAVAEVNHKPGEAIGWVACDEEPVLWDAATASRLFALVQAIDDGDAEGDALDKIEAG